MASKPVNTPAEVSAATLENGLSVKRLTVQSKHGGGLRLELRPNGLKRYVYRFKMAGKDGELLLGSHPAMTLADARIAHGEAVDLIKQGIDPRQAAKQAKARNIEMPTLGECFHDWLAMRAKSKPTGPRTLSSYQGTFSRHLEKALANVRVCELSRAVLYDHLHKVSTKEGTQKALIVLNQCLDHAVLQDHIEINPARLLKPAMFGASMSPPRERWLTRDELRLLWAALEQATAGGGAVAAGGRGLASSAVLSLSVANCLRLISLTAVRRSEAVGMRWDQLNGDRWTIPETKNGRAHVVTLCPLALEIVERQKAFTSGPYVFESTSNAGQAIAAGTVTCALDRVRLKYLAELEPFSPHDLRRSVSTGAAEYLDAPERLIELMLNHVPKDRLIRTYQVGQQAEKLRALFLRWGDFIQTLTQPEQAKPDNVVAVDFGGRG